jgi:hypothetical protein
VTSCKAVLSFAVLLLVTAPPALAQGTYTQIDYPGGTLTQCYGIDKAGDISGVYQDTGVNLHGFLLSGGIYTAINYPGSSWTQSFGMNDMGQVVGSSSLKFGFVYDILTQTFAEISYPGATVTNPFSINNAGSIAGQFYNGQGNTFLGFASTGSHYRQITPKGANFVFLAGITASGEIIGSASSNSRSATFLYNHGVYKPFAIPGVPTANVVGISPSGSAIAGNYTDVSGNEVGFLYQGGILTTLQFAGATGTYGLGVDDAGEVVGAFFDASHVMHGFTWTPPADAARK